MMVQELTTEPLTITRMVELLRKGQNYIESIGRRKIKHMIIKNM